MKRGIWRRDWFAGLVIAAIFLALGNSAFIQGLERTAYDLGLRLSDRSAGDRIAVIAIDDDSLRNLGRWPWPRDRLANMIDRLADGGARVIGNTILLSEPQIDPGLRHLEDLVELYNVSPLATATDPAIIEFGQRLLAAHNDLDTDSRLDEHGRGG